MSRNLRDQFDSDPTNGDWRDDFLVIVGVVMLLVAYAVFGLIGLSGHFNILLIAGALTIFTGGITLFAVGLYVRLEGKRNHDG